MNPQSYRWKTITLTGFMPSSLTNLASLSHLYLYGNNLTGTIPGSLCKLHKLTLCAIVGNKLSGVVPHSIFNLSSLVTLNWVSNYLDGGHPINLGTMLPNLVFFSVAHKDVTGSIPPSISNCSNLNVLQLERSNF